MIIYKTTNLLNGKIYIGQTRKNNENYYGSGKLISKAIKKYGKDNFLKEILCRCNSLEELNKMEVYWISYYNSTNNDIGYNIEKGGASDHFVKNRKNNKYIFTQKHKENISKGSKNKIITKKHRENIAKNHHDVSGEKNPMYNKKHSQTVKDFIKELNTGRVVSKDTRALLSSQRKGEQNSNAKLTKNQVVEIRKKYLEDGLSLHELAKLYHVQYPCIHKIVQYKTWKNVN